MRSGGKVSKLITITFGPHDNGIQQYEWDAFSGEHGLKLDGKTGKFCRGGVEADYYLDGQQVTFSAVFPTRACDSAILSAADLWKRHGGNFNASPEVRNVIRDVMLDSMM